MLIRNAPDEVRMATEGGPPQIFAPILALLGLWLFNLVYFAVVGGPTITLSALEFSRTLPTQFSVEVWVDLVGLPALAWFVWTAVATREVLVGFQGVRVNWRYRTRMVAWGDLRPGLDGRFGRWTVLRDAGAPWWGRSFWITDLQTRLILSNPNAPLEQFPREFLDAAGVVAESFTPAR